MRRLIVPVAICLLLFAFAGSTLAQASTDAASAANWTFNYKFENKRFYIPMMDLAIGPDGGGTLHFQRGESDEVLDQKFQLLPATMAHIRQLFDVTRFLDTDTDYQSGKDFSHLGWITIQAKQGERERKIRFNYTQNQQISELADIFRGIATAEIHLLDIDTSEQFQPLELPRLLDTIENDLKLQRITEPECLLPKLQEISGNPTQPLIARNHATQMVNDIKKGKYKTTMKK